MTSYQRKKKSHVHKYGLESAQDTPRTNLSQRRFICSRGTKGRDKRQRQETEEVGKGERNEEEGERSIYLREEADVAHRQMAVYRGKKGNPMLG